MPIIVSNLVGSIRFVSSLDSKPYSSIDGVLQRYCQKFRVRHLFSPVFRRWVEQVIKKE